MYLSLSIFIEENSHFIEEQTFKYNLAESMRIKMRKSINLTVDEDLRKVLKSKRINVSRYVEKLMLKDLALNNLRANQQVAR